MSDGADAGGPERYREFVRRMEAAAKAESPRARAERWRDVSFEERARIGIALMHMAHAAAQSRPGGYTKPPLPENPFLHISGREQ